MENWCHVPAFVSPDRCTHLEALIAEHAHRFVSVSSPLRLGPRYRTLRGEDIHRWLPDIVELGRTHVRPQMEAFTGRRLQPCANTGRAIRLQLFDHGAHEFGWHFDTSTAAALVTLRNTNGTQTQIIPEQWSRRLRPMYYGLYWTPGLFSYLPQTAVTAAAGDLLMMQGSRVLHRGVPTTAHGDRLLLVFAYEDPEHPPPAWRDRFTKFINTGYGN